MTEKKMLKKPYPLGAHCEAEGIRFSFVSESKNCGVVLYDKATGKEISRLPFSQQERIGNVYCKHVTGIDSGAVSYQFYEEDELIEDVRARAFDERTVYAKERQETQLKAVFPASEFDWEGDVNPQVPYENSVVYCMHVRGFTKHASSGVAHKGTFLGVTEKLEYLKEIGITTVELQPAYEFLEIPTDRELGQKHNCMASVMENLDKEERKLNYWGYKTGYYYTPKAGYAAGADVVKEFKNMVKAFHKHGMEVVMQFYFTKDVPYGEIPEILRYWVLEYHVDGFHLMGENIPVDMIATDPMLSHTKLWYYHFNTDFIYAKNKKPAYCNLAEYQDDYLYTMRKFLKGDEDMLGSVLYHMRHLPEKCGRIHYVSNYYGFTLKDMVSYDHKHNEANGEENRDGNDYNYSWNCGEEGVTRKKKVTELRLRQIKNAISVLLFTQSTPLIFMGDEFGNSQQGNNNPYCQDNVTTWLDWKDLEKNKEIYEFWKLVMKLRREHPILHPGREFRIMDYAACGYPDLSYHGESAWRPQMENYFRHVGIMYCGKYAKKDRVTEDDSFYIAMNMHWESHELALPKLPKGLVWQPEFSTAEGLEKMKVEELEIEKIEISDKMQPKIPARTIVVFKSVSVEESSRKQRNE